MLDALARALRNPAARPILEARAQRLVSEADDFTRLHWGARDCTTTVSLTPPAMPDRLVSLGGLHAVEYFTEKGDDGPSLYRHEFGREVAPNVWHGPRPILSVGFYDGRDGSGSPVTARRSPELFIARGRSPYRVTTHGIEG